MKKFSPLILTFLALAAGIFALQAGHVSAGSGGDLRVINLSASGFEQAKSLSFSPDGSRLAVGSTSGVHLFDTQSLSELHYFPTGAWARSVAFQPGTGLLAAAVFDGTIRFWDAAGYAPVRTLRGSSVWVRSISFSADGSLLASASDDNTLRVWKTPQEAPLLSITQGAQDIRAAALSPDGKLVAGAMGADNAVRVWSVPEGKLLYTLAGHTAWVRCLAFSPDGRLLASGSFDKNILLWDLSSGKLLATLSGHTASVLGLAFSPDGASLASGSVDGTVRLWNVSAASPVRVLQGHTGFVYAVAFSPDGATLASGGADNAVRLWDMQAAGAPLPGASLAGPQTPSDCRQCHHRRGLVDPARVVELSCADCHPGGTGLAWCQGFARSTRVTPVPGHFIASGDPRGVPVSSPQLAVLIASPANGETLYVRADTLAPEYVSGRVLSAQGLPAAKVSVQLEIFSGQEKTATLLTTPSENGEYQFRLAINPNSPPPQLMKPGTRQCLVCHGDFAPQAGLPKGDVRLVVTASGPDGSLATDERWIHVDPSRTASVPVQVLDADTGRPVSGLSVKASTILYHWRDRFGSLTTAADGGGQLSLDALSQNPTVYELSIPPQVVGGKEYASPAPVQLKLEAGATSHERLTLQARAVTGQINGVLGASAPGSSPAELQLWAVQLPAGPAISLQPEAGKPFEFKDVPVGQYRLLPDPQALAARGLASPVYEVDLFKSPLTSVSFSLEAARPLSGALTAEDGSPLPFAWLNAGGRGAYTPLDPARGAYLLSSLPAGAAYVTALAPGYYSKSAGLPAGAQKLDFQLVPQPGTRRVEWGRGLVTVPVETHGAGEGLEYNLDYGWLWGQGGAEQPFRVNVGAVEVNIASGRFALEKPAGDFGWLYLAEGSATVSLGDGSAPVSLSAGQMLALRPGAGALPVQAAVLTALRPPLEAAPLSELVEPSPGARLSSLLAKTGIGAMQTITFITYIVSLVTLFTIPLIGVFWYRKIRRKSFPAQEKT